MADKMDKHIVEDDTEATSRMDFVRNWVEEVRALASKWNSEEQNSSTGDALEFQVEYLCSLLCLVWEEVHGVDKASSREIRSYMSEMTNWITKVHVHRNSDSHFDSEQGTVTLIKPDFQIEGFEATICPYEIDISAPPCPSSDQSRKIEVLFEAPVEVESTTPDSVSRFEVISAIETENHGLVYPEGAADVISNLAEIPPDSKVTSCFLVASEEMSATFIDSLAFAKETMESWNEVVEKVMSSPDFLESHSAHYMFDEMPTIQFQLFPCSCSLKDDQMSGFGHSDLLGNPLSFVFDPGKPITDWLFDSNSTVLLVLDNWLSTFGVSIKSLDHDVSRIFIFDPGIAYIGVCNAFAALDVILLN